MCENVSMIKINVVRFPKTGLLLRVRKRYNDWSVVRGPGNSAVRFGSPGQCDQCLLS
jgi:hypothetical protein